MKFRATSKYIRKLRQQKKLSQKELAYLLNMGVQNLSNIERGVSGIPKKRARQIAKSLNITLKEIARVSCEDYYRTFFT